MRKLSLLILIGVALAGCKPAEEAESADVAAASPEDVARSIRVQIVSSGWRMATKDPGEPPSFRRMRIRLTNKSKVTVKNIRVEALVELPRQGKSAKKVFDLGDKVIGMADMSQGTLVPGFRATGIELDVPVTADMWAHGIDDSVRVVSLDIVPTGKDLTDPDQLFDFVRTAPKADVLAALKKDPKLAEVRGWNKMTMFHYAAFNKDASLMGELAKAGLDPKAVTSTGQNALHYAALNSTAAVAACRELGIPSRNDSDLQNPLFAPAFLGRSIMVLSLLKAGCPLEQRDESGKTPLLYAIYAGQLPFAIELKRAGANIKAVDKIGSNAIVYGLNYLPNPEWRRLVQEFPILNHRNAEGRTAGHVFTTSYDRQSFFGFCKLGGDPTIKDNRGRTALDLLSAVVHAPDILKWRQTLQWLNLPVPSRWDSLAREMGINDNEVLGH